MKKTIFTFLSLAILATSCQKEEVAPEAIKFSASYSVPTKASVFQSNNKATAFCYAAHDDVVNPPIISPISLTAAAGGVLTPASPIYLPKGTYDFYSVSTNTATDPGLTFIDGKSQQLTNGVDYLWAKHASVASGGTVVFNYSHTAVGVEINVTSGSGVSNLAVESIMITPTQPDANSVMSLEDGQIGAAMAVGSLTAMNIVGNTGKIIMLPLLSNAVNIEIQISATIGAQTVTNKKYTAIIPAQPYIGGTYYTLNLTVSSTELQFTGSQIQGWGIQEIPSIPVVEN